jgi:tRNA-specific 2-thiouridylase
MSRVVLAMSGGVDSSVAACLLRESGHDVIGLFMRHADAEPSHCSSGDTSLPIVSHSHKQGCCSANDANDARRVADRLGIPFYALNFEEEFGQIIDYFVNEYVAGRTPNPCVMCNNWLKFGKLCEYADSVGADYVATGHYARLVEQPAGAPPALLRGRDHAKDQSYVLFGIQRESLSRLLFPVGDFEKDEIRHMARQLGLRVAEKHDSQEICFVPDQDYAGLIERHRQGEDRSGEIVTLDGRVVGRHAGFEQFTVGQRRGLGIALGEPHYVVRVEPQSRRVVIGRREDLACSVIEAERTNWLTAVTAQKFRCQVKIRYASPLVDATAEVLPGSRLRVTPDQPLFGVAPGQALVCYDGDRVLGGGWIS